MVDRTYAENRKRGPGCLLAILALVYLPLIVMAFVGHSGERLLLVDLLTISAVVGSLVYGITQLLSAKRVQTWGLGVTDRLAIFSIFLVLVNIAAERAALALFLGRSTWLVFAFWLAWLLSKTACLLTPVLILCLMVTVVTKWRSTMPAGRVARVLILFGLLASMWLLQRALLPPGMTDMMIPP